MQSQERIIVPRAVLHGLLTAIHIHFDHPSHHKMKLLFTRYFFALDLEKGLTCVVDACHHCTSMKSFPSHLHPQSTEPLPDKVGVHFAADVMRRFRQCILVIREVVSSFTMSCITESERYEHLHEALFVLTSGVRSLGDGGIVIRVDGAPGFITLAKDPILISNSITLEIGNVKNVNKNPVAEQAIKELGLECLNLHPEGGPVSKITLARATARLNSRIRQIGLSAQEIMTQRDQITGSQLPIDDQQAIIQKHILVARTKNHPLSAKFKACDAKPTPMPNFTIGQLVYLKNERDKTKPRDKYIITNISDNNCVLRKFTKN